MIHFVLGESVVVIETISTRFMFNISVNCYLVRVDDGFVLIDTGTRGGRKQIEAELKATGTNESSGSSGLVTGYGITTIH